MAAITPLQLFLFLFSSLIICTSSRFIPPAPSPSFPTSTSPPAGGLGRPGPIPGGAGRDNYTYVCDPVRFSGMGLDMIDFPYCDKALTYEARVKDLIRSMSLAEKMGQLVHTAVGAPRIGLPQYNWWSEALHGVSNQGPGVKFGGEIPGATSFPTVIVSAASFNETLWRSIGQVVSTEARAMYNLGQAGLTFWSPNINVARDPRWGRILEVPGEDPYTVGRYGVNYVRGLQDVEEDEEGLEGVVRRDDPSSRPLKVSSCCKHWAAYDVDSWLNVYFRESFNARVSYQDMVETFLAPFVSCIKDGDVSSVMCSYNRVNGIPTCADPNLLSQTIRGQLSLNGYIVSDCDSVQVMVTQHKWLNDTFEDAVSQTLRAGLDLDCGNTYSIYMEPAMAKGKVRESDVDNALKNLYTVLMRLGYFDGMPMYDSLGKDDVCTKTSIELAADAARQGIVLLKNINNTLPWSSGQYKKIALLGPHANASSVMLGNYAGIPCRYVTPLDAFSAESIVDYVPGCGVWCTSEAAIAAAVQAAKKSDATIIFAGLDSQIEYEGKDRTDLLLPSQQIKLINEVADSAAGPVILVIMSAGGIDVTFAKEHARIGAIVWAGYPGAEGGRAIADVIFGRYNPGGRLPITWYHSDYTDELPLTSMPLRPIDELGYPGRTYKFFNGSVVYPFGFGLSYTQFNYTLQSSVRNSVTLPLGPYQHCRNLDYKAGTNPHPCPAIDIDDLSCEEDINFDVQVANNGRVGGGDVVMVYSKPPVEVDRAPIKQLVAFQRVSVPAGESETVNFTINVCKAFGLVDQTAYSVLPSGNHTVVVGDGDGAVSFTVTVGFKYLV